MGNQSNFVAVCRWGAFPIYFFLPERDAKEDGKVFDFLYTGSLQHLFSRIKWGTYFILQRELYRRNTKVFILLFFSRSNVDKSREHREHFDTQSGNISHHPACRRAYLLIDERAKGSETWRRYFEWN